MLDPNKPHRGIISNWCAFGTSPRILGIHEGKDIFTSGVVAREGDEIETVNSRYTLQEPHYGTGVIEIPTGVSPSKPGATAHGLDKGRTEI